MNLISIAGHLGTDPETTKTEDGQVVTNFTVATNVRKAGKDETVWWKVTVWGNRFEGMINHLKKGHAIMAYGDMKAPVAYVCSFKKLNKTTINESLKVALHMNAQSLSFPPFGKKEKEEEKATSESQ